MSCCCCCGREGGAVLLRFGDRNRRMRGEGRGWMMVVGRRVALKADRPLENGNRRIGGLVVDR